MSCDADTQANALLTSLLEGKSFDLPDTDLSDDKFQIPDEAGDLYQGIKRLENEDLTTREVDGDGVFDNLMTSLSAHLKKEYEQNRISGAEYTKAYIAAMEGALAQGVGFLLQREQAYWQAIVAQQQARLTEVQVVTARVQLEATKAQLAEARMRVQIAEAEYGLTKMRIATEDQQYCLLKEQTTQAAAQTVQIEANTTQTTTQTELITKQIEAADYTNEHMLPAQFAGLELDNDTKSFNLEEILPIQKTGMETDNDIKSYNLANILPADLAQTEAQTDLINKQVLQTIAQTEHTEQQSLQTEAQTKLVRKQVLQTEAQTLKIGADTTLVEKQAETADYNLDNILPSQYAGLELDNDTKTFTLNNILPAQETLLKEQGEAQRAQTQDTRSDGLPIKGSVGKQKDLYTQQIDSYKRDAEIKAAKLFTDAWITQKTVDELTPVPGAFRIDAYNAVLRNIKANNALDEDPGSQDGDSD